LDFTADLLELGWTSVEWRGTVWYYASVDVLHIHHKNYITGSIAELQWILASTTRRMGLGSYIWIFEF